MKTFLILCFLVATAIAAPQYNYRPPNFHNKPGTYGTPLTGEYPKCSGVCGQVYDPVCAKDNDFEAGQVFNNSCEMSVHVCKNRDGRPFNKVTRGFCNGTKFYN